MSDVSPEAAVRDRSQLRLFKAVSRANSAIKDSHRAAMKALGLKFGEFDLICALGNTEGMRMAELAAHMVTAPSSVSRICEKLEKRGLVTRERSPSSDREVIASLTAEGQAFFERTFDVMATFTSELFDTGLSRKEQEQAIVLLNKFCEGLTDPPPLVLP